MRTFAVASFFAASPLLTPGAHAYQNYSYQPRPDESDLDSHGHYTNRDGNSIHSPAHSRSGAVPQGATARRSDGSYSFSQHRSGTCSRHGGVASGL
ncbi:hypothetical protein AWB79_07076 [Caballeronia hypogeia]|uniref:Lipoprotein n=1 Tax=Caballeronia hypogeia TaxID=1777140 RepID=A0A158DI21_9BURK|nr:DUF3761 domain-containing protein [Caballeronia hypogeia]SAK94281.1 hypothetical protein AWB79_07076 [Caballeronia hypogeia]